MSIQLSKEIGESGLNGDHWVLVALHVHRQSTTNTFTLSGAYGQWASAAAYQANKRSIGGSVQVTTGVLQGNLTLTQMQAALDAAAVAQGGALEGGVVVL